MAATFILSIEPTNGPVYRHGFHLGTIEITARKIAEEMFRARADTRTVALLQNDRIFDVFDGRWSSDDDDGIGGAI